MNEYLTIGTVVMLKGGEKELMIIGFFPQAEIDGEKKVFDYMACYFPEGFIDSNRPIVFNKDNIDKVLYESYSDDDNRLFLSHLSKIEEIVKKGGGVNNG